MTLAPSLLPPAPPLPPPSPAELQGAGGAAAPDVRAGKLSSALAALLVVAVGLAFADAAVVVLALPDIYGQFHTSMVGVSWVLTTYAVVVAVAALGVALVARRVRPAVLDRRRALPVRRGIAGRRAGRFVRGAPRCSVHPGRRRRLAPRRQHRRARRAARRRCPGSCLVGVGGHHRHRARPCPRRRADRAARLAGDLPGPGAARRHRPPGPARARGPAPRPRVPASARP